MSRTTKHTSWIAFIFFGHSCYWLISWVQDNNYCSEIVLKQTWVFDAKTPATDCFSCDKNCVLVMQLVLYGISSHIGMSSDKPRWVKSSLWAVPALKKGCTFMLADQTQLASALQKDLLRHLAGYRVVHKESKSHCFVTGMQVSCGQQ